jgi:hypothetical protein
MDAPDHAGIEPSVPPGLERVVRAGVRAGREVAGGVAVGGTVCALYAQHRMSLDVDFVVRDMSRRFAEIRERLLNLNGWTEARVRAPVLILGSLDGVEIGYRQLRRAAPLETTELKTEDGALVIPTLSELLRIKAFLVSDRNTVRDCVDFAELAALSGDEAAVAALVPLDAKLGWEKRPRVLTEVIKALLVASPRDLQVDAYASFRWLRPRLQSWTEVETACRRIARRLAERTIIEGSGG